MLIHVYLQNAVLFSYTMKKKAKKNEKEKIKKILYEMRFVVQRISIFVCVC